jgi:hypothetical protein
MRSGQLDRIGAHIPRPIVSPPSPPRSRRDCPLPADAKTCPVKAPQLASLTTKLFFAKCQNPGPLNANGAAHAGLRRILLRRPHDRIASNERYAGDGASHPAGPRGGYPRRKGSPAAFLPARLALAEQPLLEGDPAPDRRGVLSS